MYLTIILHLSWYHFKTKPHLNHKPVYTENNTEILSKFNVLNLYNCLFCTKLLVPGCSAWNRFNSTSDLAFEWKALSNVSHVEISDHALKLLKYFSFLCSCNLYTLNLNKFCILFEVYWFCHNICFSQLGGAIMKRKFKQRWSKISTISTKQTITSNLKINYFFLSLTVKLRLP